MKKRLAAMTVAIGAWGAYVGICVAGFSGAFDKFAWGHIANGLLGVAIVASITWSQVTFAVVPRSAFRAGVEVGERRAKHKSEAHEVLHFPVMRERARVSDSTSPGA